MQPINEFPLWRGDERIDGTYVAPAADMPWLHHDDPMAWVVLEPRRQMVVQSCPCCVGLMRNQTDARRVADHVFPVRGGTA